MFLAKITEIYLDLMQIFFWKHKVKVTALCSNDANTTSSSIDTFFQQF